MSKQLAEILAANSTFLKINNIEKSMGLSKTALVRIIARKEIPEKYQQQVLEWWDRWVGGLNEIKLSKEKEKAQTNQVGLIPPHPKREDFPDTLEFGMAKNEWRKKYNL